jgi:tetratricopeptide (TPR) repeat protein
LRTLATAAFLQRHVGGAPTQSYLAKATSAKSDPFLDILRARVASGDRHPELARPILEKAAQQFPELASIAIDRADLELQAGNSDRAIALYREAIARFADMPQLRIRLGDMLNSIGKRKEAIAEYERAQVAFPKDTYVMNQLAATLTLLGDRSSGERALKLIDTAISAAPPQDKDFLEDTRAGALFVAGRKADALASYRALEKKGYALGPDSLSRYGRLLLEQKQNAAGLRALERAVDAGPRYTGWEADRATVTKR